MKSKIRSANHLLDVGRQAHDNHKPPFLSRPSLLGESHGAHDGVVAVGGRNRVWMQPERAPSGGAGACRGFGDTGCQCAGPTAEFAVECASEFRDQYDGWLSSDGRRGHACYSRSRRTGCSQLRRTGHSRRRNGYCRWRRRSQRGSPHAFRLRRRGTRCRWCASDWGGCACHSGRGRALRDGRPVVRKGTRAGSARGHQWLCHFAQGGCGRGTNAPQFACLTGRRAPAGRGRARC